VASLRASIFDVQGVQYPPEVHWCPKTLAVETTS
jgi:hypothetical protein